MSNKCNELEYFESIHEIALSMSELLISPDREKNDRGFLQLGCLIENFSQKIQDLKDEEEPEEEKEDDWSKRMHGLIEKLRGQLEPK